jgi:hypothetical protein
MTFGIAGPWDDTTPGSESKMNFMTVISGTGDDLEALDKTQFRIVFCTANSTGDSLLKDHTYAVDTDAEAFIDITTTGDHTHSGTGQGGALIDIFTANPLFADTAGAFMFNIDVAKWATTGTAVNDTDGSTNEKSIKISTGASSGTEGNIRLNGLLLNFAKRSQLQFKARIGTTSSLALHSGVNADDVTVADTNTVKYNAEVCTTVNNNWFLRTASGSNKSSSDTGIAISTSRVAIRLEHYPDIGTPRVDMYIDANAVFQKTSDIPVSGVTGVTTLIKHSLKNSTAADRTYYVYANRLRYEILDNWV